MFIVFDTLARCMVGGDENSAKDMGVAMAAVSTIERDTGATLELVHHTRKDGESERGSTALRGAIDAMISIKNDGGRLRIECEKMKDAAEFTPIEAMLRPYRESCIITPPDAGESSHGMRTPSHTKLLESLSDFHLAGGATDAVWKEASGVKGGAFYRSRKELQHWGYVKLDKPGRGGRYSLTEMGELAVAPSLPYHSPSAGGSNRNLVTSHTPSLRGGE